jgi:hypothetical protein
LNSAVRSIWHSIVGSMFGVRRGTAAPTDRPGPERSSHPGLDQSGLPNDPVAIASDVLGAHEDKSQG